MTTFRQEMEVYIRDTSRKTELRAKIMRLNFTNKVCIVPSVVTMICPFRNETLMTKDTALGILHATCLYVSEKNHIFEKSSDLVQYYNEHFQNFEENVKSLASASEVDILRFYEEKAIMAYTMILSLEMVYDSMEEFIETVEKKKGNMLSEQFVIVDQGRCKADIMQKKLDFCKMYNEQKSKMVKAMKEKRMKEEEEEGERMEEEEQVEEENHMDEDKIDSLTTKMEKLAN